MNPHWLLTSWLDLAARRGVGKANSFCFGTISADGELTSRMLLATSVGTEGVIFCTDVRSPKLSAWPRDPRASALFYWHPIHRQVRIVGVLERASEQYAERDFASKSRPQQIAIIGLEQSAPTRGSRGVLSQVADAERAWSEASIIEKPVYWQAFLLRSKSLEFFLGVGGRLNRRLALRQDSVGRWRASRLQP